MLRRGRAWRAGLAALVMALGPMAARAEPPACSLDALARHEMEAAVAVAAATARQTVPIMAELQGAARDQGRVADLSRRLTGLRVVNLLESSRARDVDVVRRLARVIERSHRGGAEPTESSPDFFLWATVQLMERTRPGGVGITLPVAGGCSYEAALHGLERAGIARLEAMTGALEAGMARIDAIGRRHGADAAAPLDRSRLDPDEKAEIDHIRQTVFAPAEREQRFIARLEDLKRLEATSELIYAASKRDYAESGGDPAAIGRGLRSTLLDERTRFMAGLWVKIAERMPSDAALGLPGGLAGPLWLLQ